MGASQNKQQLNQQAEKNIPEIRISTETWTRESHGLYDFEGNEINSATFGLRGTHNICRSDSTIFVTPINQLQTFEEKEAEINLHEREKIIARCLFRQNSYWIYHKNLIDDTSDAVLERKPEEKIWQVVKQTFPPEMDFPCYRLRRRDLIKVGRVRFKIRDIMSPVYKDKNQAEDFCNQKFKQVYPSYDLSSINDISGNDQPRVFVSPVENQIERQNNEQVQELNNLQQNDDDGQEHSELLEDTESEVEGAEGDAQMHQQVQNQDATDPSLAIGLKPKTKSKKSQVKPQQILKPQQDNLAFKDEQAVCRICLTEEEDSNNPLISPCKCAGSMRFIHHQCLQQWFHQRRVMKVSTIVTTYFWKNLECELCKQAYPYETKSLNGREMLNIIEYELPQNTSHFIVLESISSNTSKVIHVINMQSTFKLFIGRGHDAHVRVTDISVSRLHAILFKATNGFYYLTDNESKFGTLALVRSPIQLLPKMKTQLQISRTLLNIEVKEPQQGILMSCLCLGGTSTKDKKNNDTEQQLMSLDGIDYFPQEFASKAYIQLMFNRRAKQYKFLQYSERFSTKQQKNKDQVGNNHVTTQQNDSGMEVLDHVDQYIDLQGARQDFMLHDDQNRSLSPEIIQEDDRSNSENHHSIGEPVESEEDGEESEEDQQEESEGESNDGDGEGAGGQSSQDRIEQLELQQLEQAIQQSLILQEQIQNSRTDVSNLNIVQPPQPPEINQVEEMKSRSEEIKQEYNGGDQGQTSFILGYEGKTTNLPLLLPDCFQDRQSNISTSRMSNIAGVGQDLKASTLFQNINQPQNAHQYGFDNNNDGYTAPIGDQQVENQDLTIMHDLPTQVYQKTKPLQLSPQKPQTQRILQQSNELQLVGIQQKQKQTDQRTQRNDFKHLDIARQIIIEHQEAEDQHDQQDDHDTNSDNLISRQRNNHNNLIGQLNTIDQLQGQIPQSTTEVHPPDVTTDL